MEYNPRANNAIYGGSGETRGALMMGAGIGTILI